MTLTPLYDALLGDRLATARAVAALHLGAPGERCPGCGLAAPCPTQLLVEGGADVPGARAAVRRELVAQALSSAAGAPAPEAARDAVVLVPAVTAAGDDDEPGPDRPLPVLPSAAELFAPNPGTARALDALLGGRV